MFQSEKKLSGSTQKMNKTDTWVINYFNKCFNLKRSCLVLLRRWMRQILGSSTTSTNVSIWKEVVWFYSEDEQDRYLGHVSISHQKMNYFNKCFNLKRSCLVLLRRWTRQIPESSTTLTNVSIWKEVVWFYSEDEWDRYLGHQLLQQMFQSEKKLSGSTQKMNKTDTWVINYFNKCFNLKRSCLVLLRRWTRQIPESSTTLTNVSIWKEVVWFYSEDEQDRYLSHQLL